VNTEEQELIDACLAGQTEAFGELVVRYQDRLYNGLYGVLGSSDDAREIAQEAFVHAFEKLNTFQGKSAFYSWLYRIALNAAISRKRKDKRMVGSVESAREATGLEPQDHRPDAEPAYPAEVCEKQDMVRLALAELSEEFRTVLVLKEIEDMKYEEISEIVGCPVGTVRSRIHRARSELRRKLSVILKED